ncbi:homeobox protein Hox-A11-like [Liolophura sinensis]|uniref:homeobox protein Hox-A11-like n=1 Tax=Liolophura sinensis TaxID=3198878 RepID=UPI003158B5F1
MTSSGQASTIGQENRMGVASASHYQSMSSNYNMHQAYPSSAWPVTWASAHQKAPGQSSEPCHVPPGYYGTGRSENAEYQSNQHHSQPPVSDLSLNPFQYESQSMYQTNCQRTAQEFPSVEQKSTPESSNNDDILDVESYSPFSASTNSPATSDVIQKTDPGPCSSSSAGYSSGYQSCDASADSPTYPPVTSFPLGNTSCASPGFASFAESSPTMAPFRKPSSPQGTFTGSASPFPSQTPSMVSSKMATKHASTVSSCRGPVSVNVASLERLHATTAYLERTQNHTACNRPSPVAKSYLQVPHTSASYHEQSSSSYPEPLHGQAPYPPRTYTTAPSPGRSAHASYPEEATVAASYPDNSLTGATFKEIMPVAAPCMAPQNTRTPYQALSMSSATRSIPALEDRIQAPEPAPTKKPRMKYTPAQLQTLEAFFVESPYPDWDELEELSKKLDIAEQKIKVWFQNKRARWRKKNAANVKTEVPAPRPAQPTPLYGLPHSYPSMYPAAQDRPVPLYNRPMYNMW